MLRGKKVLVLGLAKSGNAAVRLLALNHATITVNVNQTKEDVKEYDEYVARGIEMICGGHPDELFERDFDFVVKNPGINYHKDFILRLKERKIPVYTEIELGYQLAKKQNYIAITGTNGKTTTVTLVHEILSNASSHAHLAGNVGTPYCDIVVEQDLQNNQDHFIVLEMSNFQLLDIEQFTPTVSCIMNLTPDHLDYMDSLEEYYTSKTFIYKNQETGCYLSNLDDQETQNYLTKYPPKCPIITFSCDKPATCCIKEGVIYYKEEVILAVKDIRIVGKHNVSNVMLAICIAKEMNVETSIIAGTIKNFMGVEDRIEFVREIDGVKVYNDSKATNTDATIIALKAFEQPVILLLGGFDKGLDVTCFKEYQDKIKTLITFGVAGPRFLNDLAMGSSYNVENLEAATKLALQIAKEEDVVLLSPSTSSFDEFSGYHARGVAFKKIVNEYKN